MSEIDFTYKADKKESWRVTKTGPIVDDCDGLTLSVLYRYYGSYLNMFKAFIKRKAGIYHVHSATGNHVVGHIGDSYFDNWGLRIMTKEEMEKDFGHKFKRRYSPLFIAYRLGGIYSKLIIYTIPPLIMLLMLL